MPSGAVSPRAAWILDDWTQSVPKFLKVFPHELQRVLHVAREKESEVAGSQALGGQILNVLVSNAVATEQVRRG